MPRSINPADGKVIADYPTLSETEIASRITGATRAQHLWRSMSYADRGQYVQQMAGLLEGKKAELGKLMVSEMGKPISQAHGEIEKCAWACRYFAERAGEFLGKRRVETDAARSYVTFEPLGLVLAIMPWNFPLWQFFRFAAPALMAGNGVLLKHAENVWGCAREIRRMADDAGLPEGLVATLDIGTQAVEGVIAQDEVSAVTLTGSTRAGRAVASAAGKHLKRCVLELGGSDPYVVLTDASIAQAARTCVEARMINNGQSCIAAKRFIVAAEVHGGFRDEVERLLREYSTGNPMDQQTRLGPLAREDLRRTLHGQVTGSIDAGAELLLGGEIPDGPGWFYPATLLDRVPADSPAYREELFGPVASIVVAADDEQAIEIANDTPYGLGAAVFTSDVERGEEIAARRLRAGCCAVNTLVKSDPRLPFGGIKHSGYGRELGPYGILEFVNIKSVVVN